MSQFVRAAVTAALAALLIGTFIPTGASAAESGWMGAARIGPQIGGRAWGPVHIATDPQGNAIAVWKQDHGSYSDIWANRFVSGAGWASPNAIENGGMAADLMPLVAIDAQGDGLVVWDHCPPSLIYRDVCGIYGARFVHDAGWLPPAPIVTPFLGQGGLGVRDLAVTPSGTAFVAWEDAIGGVWATRSVGGAEWEAPTRIGDGAFPQIALSPDGTAIAVWGGANGPRSRIWWNRFVPGAGWGVPAVVDPRMDANATSMGLDVAMNEHGVAFAVWTQWSPTGIEIRVDRFVPGTGWAPSSPVGTDWGRPQVVADARGDAVVAWWRWSGADSRHELLAIRYVHGVGWIGLTRIGQISGYDNADELPEFALASDPDGNSIVVFDDWYKGLYATRYASGVGWVLPAEIGIDVTVCCPSDLALAVDVLGNALAVWQQTDGSQSMVWSNRYVAAGPSNPPDSGIAGELAQTRALVAVLLAFQAISAASTGLLLLRHRKPRRRDSGRETSNGLSGLPALPQVLSPRGPSAADQRGRPRAAGRPWNNGGPVKLTTKERVLLHLLSFTKFADAAEVPPHLTLLGIADSAGIDTRHFAQYARPLVRDGLVRERTAHVKGVVQRRKVYVLTEEGRVRAAGVRERIKTATVRVRDASGEREATIADVLGRVPGATVLDVVRAANHEGVVDLENNIGVRTHGVRVGLDRPRSAG